MYPTDEQLGHVDIFLATTIICSLSTLNWKSGQIAKGKYKGNRKIEISVF